MKKLRVAVLYGGRSGEHEVSLQSAASVINHLDRDRFEIVPVAIDQRGRWHLNDISLLEGKNLCPSSKTRQPSSCRQIPEMRAAAVR
jgi:D-alanine-D-alanine ligase-like ATP-grasp enzyme